MTNAFRQWIDSLEPKHAAKVGALREPLSLDDLEMQSFLAMYAYWQMFVHHAGNHKRMESGDGGVNLAEAYRLGALCATMDDAMSATLEAHNIADASEEDRAAAIKPYFSSLVCKDEPVEWARIKGALDGEHTICIPMVRSKDGEPQATPAFTADRDISAQQMVRRVAKCIPGGYGLIALYELGRFDMQSDGGSAQCFGVNVCTASGDLACLSAPLSSSSPDDFIEKVGQPVWRLDAGQPGKPTCVGLGAIEAAMLGYAQLTLMDDLSSDGPSGSHINRGGIDPSLN